MCSSLLKLKPKIVDFHCDSQNALHVAANQVMNSRVK